MIEKALEKAISEEREKRSFELFNKPTSSLQLGEIEMLERYIKDYNNPTFKPIIINGVKSKYIINNLGDILSFKRSDCLPKKLKRGYNSDGYPCVKLYIENTIRRKLSISIHRLVALAFIPNPKNKPEVNHITGIKTCAWVGNLEWVTGKENVQHAYRTGLNIPKHGEDHASSACTNKQVHEICKLLAEGKYPKEISEKLNIPKTTIDMIRMRRSWNHISKDYQFLPLKQNVPRPPGTRQKLLKLFMENNYHYSEYPRILKELGLENTQRNRMYISNIKSELRNNKVETSTTIEPLQ